MQILAIVEIRRRLELLQIQGRQSIRLAERRRSYIIRRGEAMSEWTALPIMDEDAVKYTVAIGSSAKTANIGRSIQPRYSRMWRIAGGRLKLMDELFKSFCCDDRRLIFA